MKRIPPYALVALSLGLGAAPLSAGGARDTRPFPLRPEELWSPTALRLAPEVAARAALAAEEEVVLAGTPVPGPGGVEWVDLELRRLAIVPAHAELWVDGERVGGRAELEAGASLWVGAVAGEPSSEVYLAFTRTGTRGWIARASGFVHLLALEPEDGDWSRASSVLVHESDPLIAANAPSWSCGGALVPPGSSPRTLAPSATGAAGGAQALGGLLDCPIALETDYDYYDLFGNQQAAQDYALSLFGASSSRYFSQAQTVLTLPYLALYTTPADPWSSPDNGGGSIDLLFEFRDQWGGSPFPAGARLAHLISGAGLGGGVAWLDVLCNLDYGFGVSGNLNGQLGFPVPTSGALTWDFVVVTHELGHNFGTPHTHDYCPPIDECAPSGYFGQCQGQQVCQQGTIMGYCHLCSGGMTNVTTSFHPTVAGVIAERAQASCLGPLQCSGCACPWPTIQSVSPAVVAAFHPDGRTLTLDGCNFTGTSAVQVDGVELDPSAWTVLDDAHVEVELPLVPHLGPVDVAVANAFGFGPAASFDVVAPASPALGVAYFAPPDFVTTAGGGPVTVASSPGDLALVAWSPHLAPTVVPGILAIDIGNAFTSLHVLWTVFVGPSAWESRTFPLAGVAPGTHVYLQAVVLSAATGTFPLSASNVAPITVLF